MVFQLYFMYDILIYCTPIVLCIVENYLGDYQKVTGNSTAEQNVLYVYLKCEDGGSCNDKLKGG